MSRKLIFLLSLVLVFGAAVTGTANAADPILAGWWKFDGNGLDSSGNGRDGTLSGDAHFEPGYSGQALSLDGDGDYFTVDGYLGVFSASPVSVTAWVNTTATGDEGDIMYWGRNAGRRRVDFRINSGRLRVEHGSGNIQGDTSLNDGEWHHVALTMPPLAPVSYPEVKLYLDGHDDTRHTTDPDFFELVDNAGNVDLSIGHRVVQDDRHFLGMIDEVRLYETELVGIQVMDLATYGYLASAHSPSMPDGQRYEDTWGNLAWTPGPLAVSHDLYFGTNFEDVNSGAESAFVGNLPTNSQALGFPGFPAPDGLEPGATYYWRVDEVNDAHPDSPWRGEVWSFWIPPTTAYEPVPGDGEPAEPTDATLSWSIGLNGLMSNVYFGTDPDQVANATGAPPNTTGTYDPGPLAPDTWYYWRVDIFNGSAWITGPLWSFKTRPDIPVTADPNLVAWWPLDEGAGTRALDYSGHENHGTLFYTMEWTAPDWVYEGDKALTFIDDGYVAIDNLNYVDPGRTQVTVCSWVRTTDPNDQYILSFDRNEYYRLQINGEVAGPGQVGWHVMTLDGSTEIQADYGSVTRVDDGLWHHVTGVFDRGRSTIFIDGLPEPSTTGGVNYGVGDLVRYGFMGANSEATEFNGSRGVGTGVTGDLSDLRIYDKALTQDEILQAMRGDPLMAWDLRPTNGRIIEVDTVTFVSWMPGDNASQHDVYFGTDADAVAGADESTADTYRGRQSATTYQPPEGFDWGTSYFWRVDELNNDGNMKKGSVHAINVADYIVVESFEDYNDYPPDEIWNTWIDGFGTTTNGSTAGYPDPDFAAREHYVETAIVQSGRQALPLFYDNNFKFSEVKKTLTSPRDWTRHEVHELSLWYVGDPGNAAERMYIAVANASGTTAVVYHEDPNLVTGTWTEWVIPLQTLADQGVDLRNVDSIAIGLGTRGETTRAGGSGVVYFDDIRLYRERPFDPGDDGLVARYSMELDANDSSVNGLHGSIVGEPSFVASTPGYGMAIDLDGADDLIELGKFDVTGQITLAAWINADDFEINDARIISKAKEWGGNDHWWMLSTITETSLRFRLKTDDGQDTATLISDPALEAGAWAHVAATWDGSNMRIYKDGVEVASQDKGGSAVAVDPDASVAIGSQPSDAFASDPSHVVKFFDGKIDEVNIYNRALSELEIRYLAGQ